MNTIFNETDLMLRVLLDLYLVSFLLLGMRDEYKPCHALSVVLMLCCNTTVRG